MNILFLHQSFPAQFRHLATALAKNPANQVMFWTARTDGHLDGVKKLVYQVSRPPRPHTHHYVRPLESAVLEGQAIYRLAQTAKAEGFYPDVVYAHSGWGPGLFIKDIFPKARYLCYFEWFYHAHGSDADFDPSDPMDADGEAKIRVKNAPILLDLYSCDEGCTPTYWQRHQFPTEFQRKLMVCHDGVDTTFFAPNPKTQLTLPPPPNLEAFRQNHPNHPDLPDLPLDLSAVDEIVTYATRGMEPYRGFPQFMEAAALIQQRRPKCHIVVVGENRVAYGKALPNGKTYKQEMLERFEFDRSRLHFTGRLPYQLYRTVLQASSVHVYLTRPFVLSWSMLESMSTGCLVIGSKTPPVQEVIRDGVNGLLVDFFSPSELADRIDEVLSHPDRFQELRHNARTTIKARYDMALLLSLHARWVLGMPLPISTSQV
ncbi:MAG: glycosyltransferase family 4 protein [Leptolyngbyaceae cyanobacterium]